MSSSGSDVESEFSDIDQETLKEEIQELSEQIKLDPFAYDAHVKRIRLLRAAHEYDLLHDARELMAENFPLTPKLWLQWINDEKNNLEEEESKEHIEDLFKRALNDYQSVDVWVEYCHFAIGEWAVSKEWDRTRSVLEAALSAQGLDFWSGSYLFQIYREFEMICLFQLKTDVASDAEIEEVKKRIDSIFRRHLALPHMELDSTMTEYQEFLEGAEVLPSCKMDFEAAKTKWEALETFESGISTIKKELEKREKREGVPGDQTELFTAWQNYLNWAAERATRKSTKANVKQGSDVTITPLEMICLFERAITDLCLHETIWDQAANYLQMHVSADQQRLVDLLKRAVRNVTWSSSLWCRYARAVETKAWSEFAGASSSSNNDQAVEDASTPYNISREFDPVRLVFENALCNAFSTSDDLTAVWMGYCDFLLRLVQHSKNSLIKERSTKLLRDNFQRAQTHVSLAFPKQGEQEFPIYRYWAFVEAKFLGNIEQSRELWKTMLKEGHNGNNAAFWVSYLEFLKNHDDIDSLLRVAGMAVNSVTGAYAESVFQTARRCLAENALDLTRLKEFDAKVTLRRHRLNSTVNKTQPNVETANDQQKAHEKPQKSGKRKAEDTNAGAGPQAKRVKPAASTTPNESGGKWKNCGEESGGDHPKHGETVIHDPTKDDRTVFISNLPFATTEDELKAIFQKCGEVVSIRLVRDYAGKSKGFGYVEFISPDQAAAALELDRTPIDTETPKGVIGRPMFVSVCDTNRSKTSGFHYSTGVPEPKKLFVKNLDKVVSEEALKTFFGQHGTVVSVRLATFRSGAPKGHAYVEFATEDEASRALTATDGAQLGSKAISVAISNPPPRPGNGGNQQSRPQASHHQQKAKSSSNQPLVRTTAHTQLAFMPRALHRGGTGNSSEKPSTSNPPADGSTEVTGPPKSNADFRKMFLKQQ